MSYLFFVQGEITSMYPLRNSPYLYHPPCTLVIISYDGLCLQCLMQL